MTSDEILAIRDTVSHAYEHEEEYIKLNELHFTMWERQSALCTLLTLGRAEDECSFQWRQSRCLTFRSR